jgi:hypothetical protein
MSYLKASRSAFLVIYYLKASMFVVISYLKASRSAFVVISYLKASAFDVISYLKASMFVVKAFTLASIPIVSY